MLSFLSIAPQEVVWRAQETVRELNRQPHLLLRIDITGLVFPHRDAPAFVRIALDRRRFVSSWITEISADSRTLSGYFAVDDAERGTIEFGYGSRVVGRVERPFDGRQVARLDRARLPKNIVIVSREYLGDKR
ncbi:MAG: hypothetical protein ACT4P6_03665 [Gemmatimonadaceae bacterium]